MKYCAACCMAKDEDLFLKEWIAYHYLLGFEHFIIYDDNSTIPIETLLCDWIQTGKITVVNINQYRHQNDIYNHCLKNFGKDFRWIAFLDVDEFVRIQCKRRTLNGNISDQEDIRVFLAEYEPYAGLGINWRMFSSNGHENTPREPVIASYLECLGNDIHIKSIVQPSKVSSAATPHSFHTIEGEFVVNPDHFPISNGFPFTGPKTDRIAVNHYYYKSRECFTRKINRGNPTNITRSIEEFNNQLSKKTERDDSLLPFVKDVCLILDTGLNAYHTQQHQDYDYTNILLNHKSINFESKSSQEIKEILTFLSTISINSPGLPNIQDLQSSIWILRTKIALAKNNLELAKLYIKQAVIFCDNIEILELLIEYYRKTGDISSLKPSIQIMKMFLNRVNNV